MSDVITDKKLKGKDLITIGIFSAIYFVINFAFMLLGGIHPVLWMLKITAEFTREEFAQEKIMAAASGMKVLT